MPPPPPPPRQGPSRHRVAPNLFSSPPAPLPLSNNHNHSSLPLPIRPRRRNPKKHDHQPGQAPPARRTTTKDGNPAFRAPHLRTAYRKPVPSPAAAGREEALLAADPADAAAGRAVVVGPSGLSFRLPDAPFDFQYSYSEAPRLAPLAIREPAFLPFAPPSMPRPWTGKAPLLSKEEKARRKGVRLFTPLGQEPPPAVPGGAHGIMMETRGRRQLDMARLSAGDGRSREEVLGEPLTRAEVRMLVKPHRSHNRQLNIGRDGLTHNMLEMIHCHWRRQEICKVRCRGVPTVDMDNLCYHLEEKSGGKVIHRAGGVVFLFRGRNYNPRTRPRYPLMLWKPATPVYPKLIQEAPGGLTKEAADEMRKKGQNLLPICKLAKNGIYINLVKDVRDAFEGSDLVKIDCEGLEPSDYKKIAAKLKDLVPCVLLSFDNEQILMYRGKEWKSKYSKPLSLIRKVYKNTECLSSELSSSDQSAGTNDKLTFREVLSPKMLKLWKRAIESSLALVLDDAEVDALTPDSLLTKVEEFSAASQAAEHSFPALLVANGEEIPETANGECIQDRSETDTVSHQENQFEEFGHHHSDTSDDHFEDFDSFVRLESSAPLGSLPIDAIVEQLGDD